MLKLYDGGAYLVNGTEIITDEAEVKAKTGREVSKEEARTQTMAYGILEAHNISGNMERLQIKFDKLTSHDITFVGIIQTARASGLEKFPIPYVLTNCHNSLCAVGGTINEDDHMFGLTCAKKYGGVYVPPHQAVIHQFAREMLAGGGKMILGSDSHTRYGALGTMAMGEGGPELVKQLLNKTYDIKMPDVIGIYLDGEPIKGVGPQDVALAIIGATFANGYVNNKVMEFVGPGVEKLSADFRIGIDVMTTETTCLSSIWKTDDKIKEFYEIHGRSEDYKELNPGAVTYYDGMVYVNLSEIRPMIAMPFHPSNVYTIDEVRKNLKDVLHDVEQKALVSLDGAVDYSLQDKVIDGKLYVDQGIIAGCAGGGFENICAAADIIKGHYMGVDNIITFDAHDPRVQNAIPLSGFETVRPTYQFVKGLLDRYDDLIIDSDHMMAISPDEGATERAVYLANVLNLDMGMFYKRRDYTRVVNGRNPIVAHEFLGSSVEGKDVIILDDMISSGDSILDVAKQLKSRNAKRIFAAATFGLFTNGLDKFDEAYESGLIDGVLTTNLIYQTPELLSRPYYINCDMSKYVALMIDTLNHDGSISDILDPSERIQVCVEEYKKAHGQL